MAHTIGRPLIAVLVASLTVLAPTRRVGVGATPSAVHGTVLLPPARPSGGHAWLPLAVAQQGLLPTAPCRPQSGFPLADARLKTPSIGARA